MLEDRLMNADAVIIWVATWGPLVTLSSTVLLAAITAWLAYLTKVMADSAQKAAEQSRIAAEASLASVAAAEASIDVRFDVEPYITSTAGETRRALEILELGGLNLDDEVPAGFFSKISAWRGVRLTCVERRLPFTVSKSRMFQWRTGLTPTRTLRKPRVHLRTWSLYAPMTSRDSAM